MTEKPIQAAQRELDAVKKAQEAIRTILLRLEEETGKSIDSVEVDTRNFAQLATQIWLTAAGRR